MKQVKPKTKQVKPKTIVEDDVEILAEKAKAARQDKCTQAIKDALTTYKCQIAIAVQLSDDKWVPLNQVLGLPSSIQVLSQ